MRSSPHTMYGISPHATRMKRRYSVDRSVGTRNNRTTMTRALPEEFDSIDLRITRWMARNGLTVLRFSLGVVFVWFGALKLVPGLSPAEELVRATVPFLPGEWFLPVLALWEIAIGIGFLTGRALRVTILLLFLQMPGTLAPIALLPERVFTVFPYGLTLEGQYIVKNLVLIAAALVIGATVRGARLIEEARTPDRRAARGPAPSGAERLRVRGEGVPRARRG
jgi:uncharacterized membrane protein YphA (DoxX/SURF4 family)